MNELPKDFPDWKFTFSFGSEVVSVPFALLPVERSVATVKAEKGSRLLFATGDSPQEAFGKIADEIKANAIQS